MLRFKSLHICVGSCPRSLPANDSPEEAAARIVVRAKRRRHNYVGSHEPSGDPGCGELVNGNRAASTAALGAPLGSYWEPDHPLPQSPFRTHGCAAHDQDPCSSPQRVITGVQLPAIPPCTGDARDCKGYTTAPVNRRLGGKHVEFPYDPGGYGRLGDDQTGHRVAGHCSCGLRLVSAFAVGYSVVTLAFRMPYEFPHDPGGGGEPGGDKDGDRDTGYHLAARHDQKHLVAPLPSVSTRSPNKDDEEMFAGGIIR
ncbi:hypothetical protein HPB48_000134 [Haemaphysalis longicornis]|uniref:Uncharacterized protein n=1 Tax=Haemaphysalis longicornis TaxID=44386 RepID=A0A9J6GXE5_HAELO|nr:hypothetical protein HPB48_000134 [Haemaphysalis longicornis]